jgi:hypothetical protein
MHGHNPPPLRILPYKSNLMHADTADSQHESPLENDDMSPCTPTDMIQVFKTPTVCPPTPTKTPSTQKKLWKSSRKTDSHKPLHPIVNHAFFSTEEPKNSNMLLRSCKIKRVAVTPSPHPKRICSTVNNSNQAPASANKLYSPFSFNNANPNAGYSHRRSTGSKKVFKALQFNESDDQDDNNDDDIVADDDDCTKNANNNGSVGFLNTSHSILTADLQDSNRMNDSNEDIFKFEMADSSTPPVKQSLLSPIKQNSCTISGVPLFTNYTPAPSSPDLFGTDFNYCSTDEELISDDEQQEGYYDLASQVSMPGCTPPLPSLPTNFGSSPPNITRIACRLTTESVHENPFSPERNIKSRVNKSFDMDAINILSDPMSATPISNGEEIASSHSTAKKTNGQNDSILMVYFSRYIEDFTEIAVLGDGSFGKVTKVKNRMDGMFYAVKQTKKKIKGKKDKDFILKEVHALATLVDNPHIVRYFSAWLEDERLFVQTELCEGGTWADKIKNGYKFSENELIEIMRQVATGLQQMHAQNIVHLDIKPENIYITAAGNYKIGDLGLAASSLEELIDITEGDSRYLARELLSDQGANFNNQSVSQSNLLTKVDIFALGLSLYESASQRPLPNNGEEWHDIREGNLRYIGSDYSPEFVDLLKQMIHPDYRSRPTALDLLQHPLVTRRKLSQEELEKQVYMLQEMLRKQKETEEILRRQLMNSE